MGLRKYIKRKVLNYFFEKFYNYLKEKEAEEENLDKHLKFIGENVRIQNPVVITNPEMVSIGNNVSIAAFVHMWGAGGINIGNDVMIASHTAITSVTQYI